MVKRWEITDPHGWQHVPEEFSHGRWVRYEDYAQLESDLAISKGYEEQNHRRILALEAALSGMIEAVRDCNIERDEFYTHVSHNLMRAYDVLKPMNSIQIAALASQSENEPK